MREEIKKIAVVILNWNGTKLLRRFLPGVVKHSVDLAKVYVIDNYSTDGSLDILNNEFPEVEVIVLPANYGYAGGYNKGLKAIPEEFAVLLNSDVEVTANWLSPLLTHFELNPKLAALQPKIKDLKDRSKFEYAGAAGGYMDKWGYPFCRGRMFDNLETDHGQYDHYRETFWATGACLMVRQSAFREVNGLDESLFAHMEEIDLCWRFHLKGYTVGCEPASEVFHLGGGTLSKISPQKTYLNFRNSLVVMFLNLPAGEGFNKIMARLFLDGLAGIKFMFEGKFGHTWAIVKAHFNFYSRFNELMRQKANHPVKSLKELPGVYQSSVVKDYYLNKKKRFSDLNI